MKILTRQEIVDVKDIQTRVVDVPEWNGSVIVKVMSGFDRNAFDQSIVKIIDGKRTPDLNNVRLKLVALTVVDEAGNALFGQDELADLGKKNSAAIERLFEVAQELNGMLPTAVDTAVKNSSPGPNGASLSGSLLP
jgi:hypothetical protein